MFGYRIKSPRNCVICEGPHKDMHHVFFICSFALQVWLKDGLWDKVQRACTHANSVYDSIFTLVHVLSRKEGQQFSALLWSLWKHRNLKLSQGVSETVAQVVDRAIHLVEDWIMANTPRVEAHRSTSGLNSSSTHPTTSVVWGFEQ